MSDCLVVRTGGVLKAFGDVMPLIVDLVYKSEDPMAIALNLQSYTCPEHGDDHHEEQTWVFGRDLLDGALSLPDTEIGQGDVKVMWQTDADLLQIALTDGQLGDARPVYIEAAAARRFMVTSLTMVPAHKETVEDDLDAEIVAWLDEADPS